MYSGKAIYLYVFFAAILLTTEVFSQCVTCRAEGGVFFCASASNGGKRCATSSGQTSCIVHGACTRPPIESSGDTSPGETNCKNDSIGQVLINDDVVRELSNIYPLYGDVIDLIRKKGALGSTYARVYLLPGYKEAKEIDFDLSLAPDIDLVVPRRLVVPRQIDEPDVIEFIVSVVFINNSPSAIRMEPTKPISGLPAAIELKLQPQLNLRNEDQKEHSWKIISWMRIE
ncbi:MAG: hypothetical protein ACRD6X_14535 [Pyrinomonadaceae bacterium]